MKNLLIAFALMLGPTTVRAQNDTIPATNVSSSAPADPALTLHEVSVQAARVVTRNDGRVYFPSAKVKEASANAYSLLARLGLPHVRIDAATRTVTTLNNLGAVQLRLNGARTITPKLENHDTDSGIMK